MTALVPIPVRQRAHLDVRMFVAAWPDDTTLKRLSLLELGPAQGLTLVRPGQWHITLRFLGDVDDHLVPALVDALGAAAGNLAGSVHWRSARERHGSTANGCSRSPLQVSMKRPTPYVLRPFPLSRHEPRRCAVHRAPDHRTLERASTQWVGAGAPCRDPLLRDVRRRLPRPGGLTILHGGSPIYDAGTGAPTRVIGLGWPTVAECQHCQRPTTV